MALKLEQQQQASIIVLRVSQVLIVGFLIIWIWGYLGGVAFSPKVTDVETNDTSQLFNWHPILMTLAYVGCMAEAILSYSTPLLKRLSDRRVCKAVHAGLHVLATILAVVGITAAYKSHTLKKPVPMPNFYSTHSFLGVLSMCMVLGQIALGTLAFLYPQWPLSDRQAFSPLHKFFGAATFMLGTVTVMVGVQEKTTFLQLVQKPGVRSGMMFIPAILQILIAIFSILVAYRILSNWLMTMGPHHHNQGRFQPLGQSEAEIAAISSEYK
eukprot:jgi/Picsp_1/4674/NSC_02043-R1_cytochrome b561